MITGELKSKVDRIWDTMWAGCITGLHAGGQDGLFAEKNEMITGIFQAIESTQPVMQSSPG